MATVTDSLTDRQLLERFATQRDEEAFAQLVQRHGPMVLGVCRRILRREQDAEDVFQATFLVLSRKAGSIRNGEALPNWLFGVSNRLAKRLKAAAARRQAHEVPLADWRTSDQSLAEDRADIGPVLHEEIDRLPDKYRIPFVLCYLNGKTNEEAAQQLRCPPGTVHSRLARARERLRKRLTRRGVALAGALFAATLSELSQQSLAAVSQSLTANTVQGALEFRAGKIDRALDIPVRVLNLARWGVRFVSPHWLRMAAVALTLMVLCGGLVVLLLWLRPVEEVRPVEQVRPVEEPVQNRLQGSWTGAGMAPGGQPELILDDRRMTLHGMNGIYELDAQKNPMRIDWSAQGIVFHFIFELQGDQLKLCFAQDPDGKPSREPPADFSPGPGKALMLFKWLRP
jgi:RNA polymerase sigma factor (sigma-70 family)